MFVFLVFSSSLCYLALNGSQGIISSDSAGNYLSCRWVITVPSHYNVRLNFTLFQLDSSSNETFIQVYGGKDNPLLGSFTGIREHFIVQANGNIMMIKLTKGNNNSLSNFRGVFTSVTSTGKQLCSHYIYLYE